MLNKFVDEMYLDFNCKSEVFDSYDELKKMLQNGWEMGNTDPAGLDGSIDLEDYQDEAFLTKSYDGYECSDCYWDTSSEDSFEILKLLSQDEEYLLTIRDNRYALIKSPLAFSDDECSELFKILLTVSPRNTSTMVHYVSEAEPSFIKDLKKINPKSIGMSTYVKYADSLDELIKHDFSEDLASEGFIQFGTYVRFGLSMRKGKMVLVAYRVVQ